MSDKQLIVSENLDVPDNFEEILLADETSFVQRSNLLYLINKYVHSNTVPEALQKRIITALLQLGQSINITLGEGVISRVQFFPVNIHNIISFTQFPYTSYIDSEFDAMFDNIINILLFFNVNEAINFVAHNIFSHGYNKNKGMQFLKNSPQFIGTPLLDVYNLTQKKIKKIKKRTITVESPNQKEIQTSFIEALIIQGDASLPFLFDLFQSNLGLKATILETLCYKENHFHLNEEQLSIIYSRLHNPFMFRMIAELLSKQGYKPIISDLISYVSQIELDELDDSFHWVFVILGNLKAREALYVLHDLGEYLLNVNTPPNTLLGSIINAVGGIGDAQSIDLLKKYLDNPTIGWYQHKNICRALAKIHSQESYDLILQQPNINDVKEDYCLESLFECNPDLSKAILQDVPPVRISLILKRTYDRRRPGFDLAERHLYEKRLEFLKAFLESNYLEVREMVADFWRSFLNPKNDMEFSQRIQTL